MELKIINRKKSLSFKPKVINKNFFNTKHIVVTELNLYEDSIRDFYFVECSYDEPTNTITSESFQPIQKFDYVNMFAIESKTFLELFSHYGNILAYGSKSGKGTDVLKIHRENKKSKGLKSEEDIIYIVTDHTNDLEENLLKQITNTLKKY